MSKIERDHYGLRHTFDSATLLALTCKEEAQEVHEKKKQRVRETNQFRNLLIEKTPQLKDALDLNHFVLTCLDRITNIISGTIQTDQTDRRSGTSQLALVSFPETEGDGLFRLILEVNEVERRLVHVQEQNDTLFKILGRLNKCIISGAQGSNQTQSDANQPFVPCVGAAEEDLPRILYRLHNDSKESRHYKVLGICCPGWRKYSSADSAIAKDQVIRHLKPGDKSSPPFISATEHPGRIININKSADLKGSNTRVFVISFSKLRRLGAWCYRSTDLVKDLDITTRARDSPHGVQFATSSHWLIHRWVPEECIETTMKFDDFHSFCEANGITGR